MEKKHFLTTLIGLISSIALTLYSFIGAILIYVKNPSESATTLVTVTWLVLGVVCLFMTVKFANMLFKEWGKSKSQNN